MKEIKIKAPAKINLTLEVLNRRDDGFHNLKTIMQAISLYDFLTIKIEKANENSINLSGSSDEIPYNEKNIVYKAWKLFFEETELKDFVVDVYIEKNIPVAAGLAGGSTDAAGFLLGINLLFNDILSRKELHKICAKLGSDLNFCLEGGCSLCTSRGENIEKLPFVEMPVSLIKPKSLGISAKEAYTNFAQLSEKEKQVPNNTEKLIEGLKNNEFEKNFLYNSLEKAILPNYEILQTIKNELPNSLMSGSGSTFFVLDTSINKKFDTDKFEIIENLKFISNGACIYKP